MISKIITRLNSGPFDDITTPVEIENDLLPNVLNYGDLVSASARRLKFVDRGFDGVTAVAIGNFTFGADPSDVGGTVKKIKLFYFGKLFQTWKVDWSVGAINKVLEALDSGNPNAWATFIGKQAPLDLVFKPDASGDANGVGSGFDDTILVKGSGTVYGMWGSDLIKLADHDGPFGTLVWAGRGADTVNGSPKDDLINGQEGNDLLKGGGGDDNLNGEDGNDRVLGGAGNEFIDGESGRDTLIGGAGRDDIDGGGEADLLKGGPGNDVLYSGGGNDVLFGGGGNDWIEGNAGNDRLFGGGNDDRMSGNGGNDLLKGGGGDDTLRGDRGRDTLEGDGGKDELRADGKRNVLKGGDGDDTLTALGNKNKLLGGKGDDEISGRGDLSGGPGDDDLDGRGILDGGPGNDDIFGTGILSGGNGNDSIMGDGVLIGGYGNDVLEGSIGADLFDFSRVGPAKSIPVFGSFGSDRIKDFDLSAGYHPKTKLPVATITDRIRLPGDDYSLSFDAARSDVVITAKAGDAILGTVRVDLPFEASNRAEALQFAQAYLFGVEQAIAQSNQPDDFFF